jgi:hypothetical protein
VEMAVGGRAMVECTAASGVAPPAIMEAPGEASGPMAAVQVALMVALLAVEAN